MGASKNRGTPKWMVYNGNLYLKWMIWGVKNPIFGNTHMSSLVYPSVFLAYQKNPIQRSLGSFGIPSKVHAIPVLPALTPLPMLLFSCFFPTKTLANKNTCCFFSKPKQNQKNKKNKNKNSEIYLVAMGIPILWVLTKNICNS